ncbi:hypothetical protein BKA65DRAFT_535343 [Rhexocercosporidium sp. MPI-PUGE-AT-0058]|nr:hypothetical protein BKA65DRAFT_535343 [Rhexocercosporidium sp. MPI-PUGE-AT-0058]
MWLHTKAEPLSKVIETAKTNNFIEPFDIIDGFFPGAKKASDPPELVAQRRALKAWFARLPDITREQRKLVDKIKKSKADRAQRVREANIALGKKRAAESALESPYPKRTTADLDRDRREAEENVRKLAEEQARRKEGDKIPQFMEELVRRFDTAVRNNLELKLAAYKTRKAVAIASGTLFAENEPTLDDEIKQYHNQTREKERHDAQKLQKKIADRAARGNPLVLNGDLLPGVDDIYAAWKAQQVKAAKELAEKAAGKKAKEAALKNINEEAEKTRLKALKDAKDAADKKTAEEKRKADEAAAARAKLTPAQKNREKRRLTMQQRMASLEAKQKADRDAMLKAASQQQIPPPALGQVPSTQTNRTTAASTGDQTGNQVQLTLESQAFRNEQSAIEASLKEDQRVRRANLEENIIIRAQTAGQTIAEFIREQGFNSKEEYILSMLRTDIVLPLPSSPAPPAGPAEGGLIKTLPPPVDKFISNRLTLRLKEVRERFRLSLQKGLTRRAIFEKKTQLQVVRSLGYYDVTAYLNNLSNSIRPEEINDDVPSPRDIPSPPPLPFNATRVQIDRRNAEVASVGVRRINAAVSRNREAAKKATLFQRFIDAENFQMAAQILERNPPPRVRIYDTTVPGGHRRTGDDDKTRLEL